jgi:hypothetical protein
MNVEIMIFKNLLAESKMSVIFAHDFRAISSVGSEHLPYKQRVGGSRPSSPTEKTVMRQSFLVLPGGFYR